MSLSTEELYDLLPAIYQRRDAQRGEPLRALAALLAAQGRAVEDDIARLYDDWFIETCEEWVVPYIAELFGIRGLQDVGEGVPFSRRALVANTLAYRRRKGTAAVLEQLAFDTTGWRTRAVEMFMLLAGSQHVNHVRHHAPATCEVRDASALELVGTAFDGAPHTVDVRRIEPRRGRHNIPNVALFLWRLQSYRLLRSELRGAGDPARWHVDPVGLALHLFNPPQTETRLTQATAEHNVPVPLRRRPLADELEARRQAIADGDEPRYLYFDDRADARVAQVFELLLDGVAVPPAEIEICNLASWRQPPDSRSYTRIEADGSATSVDLPLRAAVDPVLGRVTLAPAAVGAAARMSFCYGFAGDLGGGPYDRRASVAAALDRSVTWQAGVTRELSPVAGELFATLGEALTAWSAQPAGSVGVIAVMDTSSYAESLTGPQRIEVPEGSLLLIVAADWPAVQVTGGLPGELRRQTGRLDPGARRAHLLGDVEVLGTAPADSDTPGELILDGLLIEGDVAVADGNLGRLRVAHGTVVPESHGVTVSAGNPRLTVELERAICGPLALDAPLAAVRLSDCIVHAGTGAITAEQTGAELCRCTVLGETRVREVSATECIFAEPLVALRRQEGCLRFSSVAEGSVTPRRFRCQPDLALRGVAPAQAAAVQARLVPSFTSTVFGEAGYGQLGRSCAAEITAGAGDGAEMGAFHFLQQPQRIANLRANVGDYLRFGLEAGELVET